MQTSSTYLSKWYKRAILVALTLTTTVFTFKNILDEWYVLGSWGNVLFFLIPWLVAPFANAMVGLFSKSPSKITASIATALFQNLATGFYAYDGSTSGRFGAQHMHLLFFPPILMAVSVTVFMFTWAYLQQRQKASTDKT